jgi:hypothetical protein
MPFITKPFVQTLGLRILARHAARTSQTVPKCSGCLYAAAGITDSDYKIITSFSFRNSGPGGSSNTQSRLYRCLSGTMLPDSGSSPVYFMPYTSADAFRFLTVHPDGPLYTGNSEAFPLEFSGSLWSLASVCIASCGPEVTLLACSPMLPLNAAVILCFLGMACMMYQDSQYMRFFRATRDRRPQSGSSCNSSGTVQTHFSHVRDNICSRWQRWCAVMCKIYYRSYPSGKA